MKWKFFLNEIQKIKINKMSVNNKIKIWRILNWSRKNKVKWKILEKIQQWKNLRKNPGTKKKRKRILKIYF